MIQSPLTRFRSPNTNLLLSDALDMRGDFQSSGDALWALVVHLFYTSRDTRVVPKLQKLFIMRNPINWIFSYNLSYYPARASDNL